MNHSGQKWSCALYWKQMTVLLNASSSVLLRIATVSVPSFLNSSSILILSYEQRGAGSSSIQCEKF